MLFLTFPGVFLPIDVIYAVSGVMTYATPDQAARIFLYLVALSLVASGICCLCCMSAGLIAGGGRRYDAGKAAFAALWLCLVLVAFALFHGLLIWSSYFINYSPELRWLRELAVWGLSVTAGSLLARRGRKEHLAAILAVLRANALVVVLGAFGCLGIVALQPQRDPGRLAAAHPKDDRPSIFLITIDTLSALHLPMYGYRRQTAPRLAEFARGATLFSRSYASSNFTTSSVTSLLSGLRPWQHRVIQLEGRPLGRLSDDSLPAVLSKSGYFTASVSTNPWASPRHLRIDEHFAARAEHRVCAAANPQYMLETDLLRATEISLAWNAMTSLVMQAADALGACERGHFDPELAFSEARRILAGAPPGRPLFLWVHLFPPHAPYVTPAPFVGTFNPSREGRDRSSTIPPNLFEATYQLNFPGALVDRYDEAIEYLDHHIGAFLDELRRQDRYDRSLVVVTADHGESFTKGFGNHGGPMLHEELVRVPLLIKAPGQTQRREVSGLSELADLKPTILAFAGIRDIHPDEGVSLVPAIHGKSLDRPVFSMNFEQSARLGALDTGVVAMVEGQWKYVHFFGSIRYPFMPELRDALYDLSADPWEARNLVRILPDVAVRMRREIETGLRTHGGRIE